MTYLNNVVMPDHESSSDESGSDDEAPNVGNEDVEDQDEDSE